MIQVNIKEFISEFQVSTGNRFKLNYETVVVGTGLYKMFSLSYFITLVKPHPGKNFSLRIYYVTQNY